MPVYLKHEKDIPGRIPPPGTKRAGSPIVGPGTDFIYLRKPGLMFGPDGKAVETDKRPPLSEQFARKHVRRFRSGCPACREEFMLLEGQVCPACRYPKPRSTDLAYFKIFGALPSFQAVHQRLLREWAEFRQVQAMVSRPAYAEKARDFMGQTKWGRANILREKA